MPNIRRTFPGRSVPVKNDDEDEDDDNGGTPHTTYHHPNVGGKQFGKSLRPPTNDDDDVEEDEEDDDDDDDSDEEGDEVAKPTTQLAVRRSGKQLAAGTGKYLRPSNGGDDEDDEDEDDDDDDDDDDDEPAPVVNIQPRSGGKNISRMVQPAKDGEEEEDDDDDDDDDDGDGEPEEGPTVAYRVQGRGGGKSLSRMAPTAAADDDDDDNSDDDEEEVVVQKVVAPARGKSIRPPTTSDSKPTDTTSSHRATATIALSTPIVAHPKVASKQVAVALAASTVSRGPSGGKVLRKVPDHEDNDDDKPPALSTLSRGPGGGKTLRRPHDIDDADADEKKSTLNQNTSATVVARSPAGGKVLRRPPTEDPPSTASVVVRSPTGGKVLRRATTKPDDDQVIKSQQTIGRATSGGKQLSRKTNEDDDEDDDDDEVDFDDDDEEADDDDDDDDDFEEKPSPPKKTASRPKRAAAVKAAAKSKIDDEIIGDDDRSLDDEEELDINNTEALIKDEDDRKYLDSLPELEREAILGERFDKLKEKQDMQRAIAEARRKEQKTAAVTDSKSKRKAPSSKDSKKKSRTEKDEELAKKLAGTRSSARAKDVSGAKSKKAAALAALKRQRKIQQDLEESSSDGSELDFGDDDEDSDEDYEDAGLKPWQKKAKAGEKSAAKAGDDSDMDIDDDDDNEKVVTKTRSRTNADSMTVSATDAALEDFLKVTIPRRRLSQWCNEPFFDAAVLECFVRLFIGEDGSGEKVYRLCEIVDVKMDKRSYKFPVIDKNEKPVSTNKFLRLKFGNNERDFPMNLVSDTPPTELDIQKYLTTQKNNRNDCLSKRRATKLRRTQDHLVTNYNYTTEDIERSLMQRKTDGKSISKLGAAQTKLGFAVQAAKDELLDAERRLTDAKKALVEFSGNAHDENELEISLQDCTRAVETAKKELDDLLKEEQETLHAVKNRAIKLAAREKDQNWAKVNRRALEINQKVDRESYKVQKEIDARKAAGEKEKFNPYARRKVKPKILWEVGQAKDDDDVLADSSTNVDVTAHTPTNDTPMEKGPTSLLYSEANKNSAMLLVSESHQFVIDEEGLAAQQLSFNFQNKTDLSTAAVPRTARVRKGISMSQYLQQKGLV